MLDNNPYLGEDNDFSGVLEEYNRFRVAVKDNKYSFDISISKLIFPSFWEINSRPSNFTPVAHRIFARQYLLKYCRTNILY